MLETISETYDLEVVEPPIPKTIKFAEAPAAGRSILRTSRSSKGAQAYREVADGAREAAASPGREARRRDPEPALTWAATVGPCVPATGGSPSPACPAS